MEKEINVLNYDNLSFKHGEFDLSNPKIKILILGTRVTDKSIEAGYYYLGLSEKLNCFWNVLNYCFDDDDFLSNDRDVLITTLKKYNIVVSDLLHSCKYTGSKDSETVEGSEEVDFEDLYKLFNQADLVLLNGGKNQKHHTGVLDYFHKFFGGYIVKNSIKNLGIVGESGLMIFENKKTPYLSLINTSNQACIKSVLTYKLKNYKDKKDAWKSEIEWFITSELPAKDFTK